MAAKRFNDESGDDPDRPAGSKRMRTRPSFSAVIGEVLMANSVQNIFSALEPMLRRVVNEELERGMQRGALVISRSLQLQIHPQESSTLQLNFTKKLSLPVFTGNKIEYENNNQLQVILVNVQGDQRVLTTLPHPIKIEIVVVDGDFSPGDYEDWTSEKFNSKIVRERTGKRPLITGDVHVTIRDGFASINELTFTDNSSWIRSRKFRIGARVEQGSYQGARIREAITEPFAVKDHRGELYRKHHPPSLKDEVWRLEKIGKDGAFHKKLSAENINTVQEFLKLWIVEPTKLRAILGAGMSDKMFEITVKHARTCVLGNKHYMFRGPCYTILLNPICQVVGVMLDGKIFPTRDLNGVQRVQVESLVKEAYLHWNSLEEVDRMPINENALLPIGNMTTLAQYPEQGQNTKRPNQPCKSLDDDTVEIPYRPKVLQAQQSDLSKYFTYLDLPVDDDGNNNYHSDSSSDGDSTPSTIFYSGTS